MEAVGSRDYVKERMSLALRNTTNLSMQASKTAVGYLMWSITNPNDSEKRVLGNTPYIRYITLGKDGCFGFCGKKIIPSYGPPSVKDIQRMARFNTVNGGMGGSKKDIEMIGVMYNGKVKRGAHHRALANKFHCPSIFLHKSSFWRNQPKRDAVWGYYWPSKVK